MDNDDLVTKCIKIPVYQVQFIKEKTNNFSRYIRGLIDRDIGESKAKTIFLNERMKDEYKESVSVKKEDIKPLTWNFPSK